MEFFQFQCIELINLYKKNKMFFNCRIFRIILYKFYYYNLLTVNKFLLFRN